MRLLLSFAVSICLIISISLAGCGNDHTPTGSISEYAISASGSAPNAISSGPDGNLWYTDGKGYIGKITTGGVITEYAVPVVGSSPYNITSGPDGNLWFTDIGGYIGKITTSGVITMYVASFVGDITSGPDGNLWFTKLGGFIGKITTSGVITMYTIPTLGGGQMALQPVLTAISGLQMNLAILEKLPLQE
ncbi:MAG: hypothetical protein M0T70_16985 [Geobacteraceae bacterium]|nr:hypothetical protein [Geobacteraceae bacterium]